jgi:hypothetical protein
MFSRVSQCRARRRRISIAAMRHWLRTFGKAGPRGATIRSLGQISGASHGQAFLISPSRSTWRCSPRDHRVFRTSQAVDTHNVSPFLRKGCVACSMRPPRAGWLSGGRIRQTTTGDAPDPLGNAPRSLAGLSSATIHRLNDPIAPMTQTGGSSDPSRDVKSPTAKCGGRSGVPRRYVRSKKKPRWCGATIS